MHSSKNVRWASPFNKFSRLRVKEKNRQGDYFKNYDYIFILSCSYDFFFIEYTFVKSK